MFKQYISEDTLDALSELRSVLNRHSFYLAGGTGLALQLGHRYSLDLDFFTEKIFNTEILSKELIDKSAKIKVAEEDTVHTEIYDVFISFFYYPYPLVFPVIGFQGISVADFRDIAAMKLIATSQRAEKKDYFDMVFIFKCISPADLKGIMEKKFPKGRLNWHHITKSLFYFDDVEHSPDPKCDKMSWKEVKNYLLSHQKGIENCFLEV